MPEFTRFTETITKKQNKRVINITVKPTTQIAPVQSGLPT